MINYFKCLDFKRNALGCLYGNQTSKFSTLEPATLQEYFSLVLPEICLKLTCTQRVYAFVTQLAELFTSSLAIRICQTTNQSHELLYAVDPFDVFLICLNLVCWLHI